MEKLLGIPVVPTVAISGEGIRQLHQIIRKSIRQIKNADRI
jgi:Fe2+ transport system protein B